MTYMVNGYIGGVSYAVQVGSDAADGSEGPVQGNDRIAGLLHANEGRAFRTGVTGQSVTLSLQDAGSVLPALLSLTEVTDVTGDAPGLPGAEDFDPGVEY